MGLNYSLFQEMGFNDVSTIRSAIQPPHPASRSFGLRRQARQPDVSAELGNASLKHSSHQAEG